MYWTGGKTAYGSDAVKGDHDWALHCLPKEVKGQPGPICGVFDPRSPVESAKVFRERVHFVGFMNERSYLPGEMRTVKAAHYLPNRNLFQSNAEATSAFQSYPLKPLQKTDPNAQTLNPTILVRASSGILNCAIWGAAPNHLALDA